MYGYVRPVKSELRLREYEMFRAAYCGLCEALKNRCGFLARFLVNYDLTFMAMALSAAEGCMQRRRCPAHPLRRRYCLCDSPALDTAAYYSVILAMWKIRDDIQDGSFLKSLVSRVEAALLKSAYRKAAAARPEFDRDVSRWLKQLADLEREKCDSLDKAADCFAQILAAATAGCPEPKQRILRELFYHTGRCVYLLDAIDDLAEDWKNGGYNPLIYRFDLSDGVLNEEQKQQLRSTLNLSQHSMAAAMQLLEDTVWKPILENVVCLGIPTAAEKVLSGQWNKREKGKETIPLERWDEYL